MAAASFTSKSSSSQTLQDNLQNDNPNKFNKSNLLIYDEMTVKEILDEPIHPVFGTPPKRKEPTRKARKPKTDVDNIILNTTLELKVNNSNVDNAKSLLKERLKVKTSPSSSNTKRISSSELDMINRSFPDKFYDFSFPRSPTGARESRNPRSPQLKISPSTSFSLYTFKKQLKNRNDHNESNTYLDLDTKSSNAATSMATTTITNMSSKGLIRNRSMEFEDVYDINKIQKSKLFPQFDVDSDMKNTLNQSFPIDDNERSIYLSSLSGISSITSVTNKQPNSKYNTQNEPEKVKEILASIHDDSLSPFKYLNNYCGHASSSHQFMSNPNNGRFQLMSNPHDIQNNFISSMNAVQNISNDDYCFYEDEAKVDDNYCAYSSAMGSTSNFYGNYGGDENIDNSNQMEEKIKNKNECDTSFDSIHRSCKKSIRTPQSPPSSIHLSPTNLSARKSYEHLEKRLTTPYRYSSTKDDYK